MSRILFKEYRCLLKEGNRSWAKGFSLFWMPFHSMVWKVGVSKRCGNACVRNKKKRQIRNFLREFRLDQPCLVLLVETRSLDMKYDEKKKYCWNFLERVFSTR